MAASEFLKARQTRYGAYVFVYVAVIIAILGAVNYLASQHNKTFDTTTSKRFTLSDQTKKIVGGLKNDVTMDYFDRTTSFSQGKELLDRYSNLSPKLHVNYIDPDKKPDLARAAAIRGYGTTVIHNGANTQQAKTVSEEELTGALMRTMKSAVHRACFVTGSGELAIEGNDRGDISTFKAALEKSSFTTKSVSLIEKPEVPGECEVLVVAGPKRDYVQPAVDAVKKFLDAGGKGLFLIDPAIDFGKGDANGGSPLLVAMLSGYGITLNNDLVIDASGAGQMFGLNEATPIVTNYESQAIVTPLKRSATIFPLTRSIDVKAGAEKLFSTSANSYSITNPHPPIKIDPAKDKQGAFVLGAVSTLPSKGRLVVVGTSGAVANQIFGASQIGNRDLFLNMMNWLTADEEMISIRPKDPEDRRIAMNGRQMTMMFYLTVVLIPLAIIGLGISVYWRRR